MYNIDNSINNVYTNVSWSEYMETRVQKWGNSDGIRIPKSILNELNIKTNDIVDVIKEDGRIIITPKKKILSLEDRFKEYDKLKNEATDIKEYVDFGKDVGKEIW